jgi:hypothetical protein
MPKVTRRKFLTVAAASATLASAKQWKLFATGNAAALPMGSAPPALDFSWFPNRLHAFVWRNWGLVPRERMGRVVGAKRNDIVSVGHAMGLELNRELNDEERRRAGLTIIRRNWHLLPYEQLLELLGWTADQMAYTLREDDFFFVKLGLLKPKCEPLRWSDPTPAEIARATEIRKLIRREFPVGHLEGCDPLFAFVKRLGSAPSHLQKMPPTDALRLGYSYFALYGDPLLDAKLNPYPDGYLAGLAAAGVNAVWLQGVLARLARLPWSPERNIDQRLAGLRNLITRAAKHGIKIFLYLNEPRALPVHSDVFRQHPDWRGVAEGEWAAVCTSAPEVRNALRDAISAVCVAAPDLGGFFSISASENLTSCWSHYQGANCPRCKNRSPAEVIAEVNATFDEGIRAAGGKQRMIVWDWGWQDAWAPDAITKLPAGVDFMSVSEWSLPIERGGVKTVLGEYSLSSIGPGPRALRHWEIARKRGLRVVAKIQTGNSWELSSVPYLPVVENVARHIERIRKAGVEDLMLGWTLGGHPSPNMEAIAEITAGGTIESLAQLRFGKKSDAVVDFWRECSAAFREFPFHNSTVYNAPQQMGPANPLWKKPTHYAATMVGIPYDDLDAWRGAYPPEIFASQLEKVATGFQAAVDKLRSKVANPPESLREQILFAEAAGIHFASAAQQTRFVMARRANDQNAMRKCAEIEISLAKRLHALQSVDGRIGFEASNQYFYTPLDLVEKVINCRAI